jgi:RNA polymerase sigma-70 factor (ECF subfamily)
MEQPCECDWSLDRQYDYLLMLARCRGPLLALVHREPADLVQETCRLATANRRQFKGRTEAEWRGWLRTIQANALAGLLRGAKGWPQRSLDQAAQESSARLERFLAADQSTPSRRLMREEQLARLAEALAGLPEDQRQAVRLHHLERLSLLEVGQRMDRPKAAVAGLIFRGLKKLRECMAEPE